MDAHLGLARAYLALGDYASAKIEFETVLRFDDMPADLHQQVEIYADAAESYAEGKRLLPFGYAIAGFGNYSVNDTSGTDAFGGGDTDDNFFNARVGGGLNYELDDGYALNGTLDYRYRNYDNDDRRDDKDLRWNGAVSRVIGEGNIAVGVGAATAIAATATIATTTACTATIDTVSMPTTRSASAQRFGAANTPTARCASAAATLSS